MTHVLKPGWNKADDTMYGNFHARRGQEHYHLVVERLPTNNGWDWTVWRPGDAPELSQHGYAPGLLTAMAAAEEVAQYWHARGGTAAAI